MTIFLPFSSLIFLFLGDNGEFGEHPAYGGKDDHKHEEYDEDDSPRNDPKDDVGSVGSVAIPSIDRSMSYIAAKEESRIPFDLTEAERLRHGKPWVDGQARHCRTEDVRH